MTTKEFVESTGFDVIALPEPERKISGVYIGDLLSWVMGRADADDLWITIMSNSNIVAVATLSGVGCILLTEGVTLDEDVKALAESKGINVCSTKLSSYEAAIKVSGLLK